MASFSDRGHNARRTRAGWYGRQRVHPWKDDLITSCAHVVSKVVRIAKELGREIARPAEIREMLGLRKR